MTGSSPRLTCCAPSHPHFILFTTPVYLNSIPLECRTCPICAEPYIEPSKSRPNLEDTDEWAMRVDMSATDAGSRKCCGHIFGRRCLEKHINSHGVWHSKCPLCRQEWWTTNSKELPQHRPRWPTNEQDDSDGSVRRQDLPGRSSFVRQVLDVFAFEGGNEQIDATVDEVEERLALLYKINEQKQMASFLANEQHLEQDSEAAGAW